MASTRYIASTLLLLALGCGTSHSPGDGGAPLDDATPLDDAAPPAASCLEACEDRLSEEATAGWCPVSDCAGQCAALAGQSVAAGEALEGCLRENPLCFETLDSCVLYTLYDETVPAPVTLVGEGLSAWEGRAVVAWVSRLGEEPAPREVTIRDGGFVLELGETELRVRDVVPDVEGFLDLDGDGDCSSADIPLREFTRRTGSFDAPAYEARFSGPSDRDLSFVCDRL